MQQGGRVRAWPQSTNAQGATCFLEAPSAGQCWTIPVSLKLSHFEDSLLSRVKDNIGLLLTCYVMLKQVGNHLPNSKRV